MAKCSLTTEITPFRADKAPAMGCRAIITGLFEGRRPENIQRSDFQGSTKLNRL